MATNNHRKCKHCRYVEPTIQIAPFVDVVLVLLVIFMIASPLALSGLKVDLPAGSQNITIKQTPITITYMQDSKIYVNEQSVPIINLLKTLKQKSGNNKDIPVFIRGHKRIAYGQVMSIVQTLHRAGYTKATLVTETTK